MERDEVEVVMLRGVERMACRGHVARLTMDNTQDNSMAVGSTGLRAFRTLAQDRQRKKTVFALSFCI